MVASVKTAWPSYVGARPASWRRGGAGAGAAWLSLGGARLAYWRRCVAGAGAFALEDKRTLRSIILLDDNRLLILAVELVAVVLRPWAHVTCATWTLLSAVVPGLTSMSGLSALSYRVQWYSGMQISMQATLTLSHVCVDDVTATAELSVAASYSSVRADAALERVTRSEGLAWRSTGCIEGCAGLVARAAAVALAATRTAATVLKDGMVAAGVVAVVVYWW